VGKKRKERKSTSLRRQLAQLLNSASRENESNTPDYILAAYMINCLQAYESAVNARDVWYGRIQRPGQQQQLPPIAIGDGPALPWPVTVDQAGVMWRTPPGWRVLDTLTGEAVQDANEEPDT
jgi:hypothetical protein